MALKEHQAPELPEKIPEEIRWTADEGLTEDEAAQRRQQGLGNDCTADPGKTTPEIICSHLFTLFNLLNVVLAACLALVGSFRNMLFMGVVVSNTLIGAVQELRAHHTIRKLQLLNLPAVNVLREGKKSLVKADALVRDDLIVLHAGDQVPADAIVRGGTGAVNESLLTGEADPVNKKEGQWLYSGSYVTEGTLTAQLVMVGKESYISRLSAAARTIVPEKTALTQDLDRIIRVVSIALIPIGIALFCKQYFFGGSELNRAVTSSVAAMIGMIPEGLLLLTSVALAVGVVKLGSHQTMVQSLHGIETLARADVLCLDKTGTLTTGDMTLVRLLPLDTDEAGLTRAAARFAGAFEERNGTLRALCEALSPIGEKPVETLPFSSARKLSAARFADGQVLILGAASFVLGSAYTDRLKQQVEAQAAQGLRVVVLAESSRLPEDGIETPVTRVLGLCLFQDTLRPHCEETLAYFRKQSVSLRVISGDDPRTVAAVAARAGLPDADRWVDVSTLKTDEELADAAGRYVVFGRVTPARKCALVLALKQQGHSVAMTGDGVNDIPAMKAADCSIAMAGGSDAAKHAAQLTLLSSDFACMPMVVDEGRRVVNNITRAASLFLVKTLYSFALGLMTILLPTAYPFQPIQLTLISTLTIGCPTFVLALQPNHDPIRGHFLRTVLTNALPGALTVVLEALVCMLLEHFGMAQEVCSTLATLSAGAVGLSVLFSVCRPFNALRAALFGSMTVGFVLAWLLLGSVFYLTALQGTQWLILAGLVGAGVLLRWLIALLLKRVLTRGGN